MQRLQALLLDGSDADRLHLARARRLEQRWRIGRGGLVAPYLLPDILRGQQRDLDSTTIEHTTPIVG